MSPLLTFDSTSEASMAARVEVVRPVVSPTRKIARVRARPDVKILERVEVGQNESPDTDAEPDYSWRRKAITRRLHASRKPSDPPVVDFTPVLIRPREQNGLPLFEQSTAELAGRSDEGAAGRRRFERPAIWTACIFAASLTVIAFTTVFRSRDAAASSTAVMDAEEAVTWARVWQDHSRIPDARQTVASFYRARTPEEKVLHVRGGESMLPVMREHYARHPDEEEVHPGQDVKFGTDLDRDFLYLHGTDSAGRNVGILLEDTASGMKLDWKFLTGAGERDWSDWIAGQPCFPVSMRVEAVLDDYYSGQFSDASEWVCLRITDVAHTSEAWAYIPRNSDDGLTIQRQLGDRLAPVRMAGLFEFPSIIPPGGKTAPQVFLHSVAPHGWMDRSFSEWAYSSPGASFIPQPQN